jgi:hypothetical protein
MVFSYWLFLKQQISIMSQNELSNQAQGYDWIARKSLLLCYATWRQKLLGIQHTHKQAKRLELRLDRQVDICVQLMKFNVSSYNTI